MKRTFAAVAIVLAFSSLTMGQNINVDFNTGVVGDQAGGPIPATFAAAGTAGCWNLATGVAATNFPALQTGAACTPTAVSMTRSSALGGNFAFNNATTAGNDGLLLDDGQDLSATPAGPMTVTFAGLANGPYDVIVYAWAPDAPTVDFTTVTIGGAAQPNVGGAGFTGTYVQGQHYARANVNVVGGTLVVTADGAVGSFGTLNGIQLRFIPEPSTLGLLAFGALALIRRRK